MVRSSTISKLASFWSQKSSHSRRMRRAWSSARSTIWRARPSAALTTSVRCTIRSARWLLKEREEYLAKVKREGEDILDQARTRAERMVQRTEVVKASEARARKIVDTATDEASRLKNEVEDFCDQKLASFEIVLERTMKLVGAGRQKLQGSLGSGEIQPGEAQDEPPGGPAVFDQDLG